MPFSVLIYIVPVSEIENVFGITHTGKGVMRIREDVYDGAIAGKTRDRFALRAFPVGVLKRPFPHSRVGKEVRAATAEIAALKFEVLQKVGEAVGKSTQIHEQMV